MNNWRADQKSSGHLEYSRRSFICRGGLLEYGPRPPQPGEEGLHRLEPRMDGGDRLAGVQTRGLGREG